MRSLFGVLILATPALALAQPGQDPAPPPYQPATGSPPYSGPPPQQPGPYNPNNGTQPYTPPPSGPQQPQPYYPPQQPQPYYPPQQPQGPYGQQPYGYQPYQQPYQPQPAPPPLRDGMTFEVSLGIGWLQGEEGESSDAGLGFGLGIGGWLNKNMAVTGRLASTSVTFGDDGYGGNFTMHAMFLGPSLQYWIDDGLFIRAGAGIAIASVTSSSYYADESDSINGFGLDLGVGYNFTRGTENTFNASLELTPGFYNENGSSATLGGITINVGYQHL